jgi:GT2 family glycosyltransferase
MSGGDQKGNRVWVDGKFFRQGDTKFYVKGITYGPFAPNHQGEMFPSEEKAARDFEQIRELGANVLRVYYIPPVWLLDLAAHHGLKLLVDIPWPKHLCFLDSPALRLEALTAIREAVTRCKGHPAVFAYSVVNEIPAEIVRWSGTRPMERFIDELVEAAKSIDPHCLCTFSNFPPTEFLNPERVDFVSFNVYLHESKSFESYLARLQMLADAKPLLLSELGMDSLREGEARKTQVLYLQIESAFRYGLAGAVVFSYTDDWFRGGLPIYDWAFGLTTRDRQPKDSFRSVQRAFAVAPYFRHASYPKVSVVVASYNGGRTLAACLQSLGRLRYPNFEVILVDDGSTDGTIEIAKEFPFVQTIRQDNCGLSAARNRGIAAASGEIVAFTDSDCRADEDWLYYLVGDLLRTTYAGAGGHNLLPPDDSPVAAAVMVSPGGPAHVMLTDTEAEHIPGCNMAFYKKALNGIGGFDPLFRKAGDDVDVCWRLQQQGCKIGFSPAAMVWHYRRSTVRAYLKQQNGYGEAEALLLRKHPQYFNSAGRSRWAGRIYATSKFGLVLERSIIYHGLFGSAFFQRLYAPSPSHVWMFFTAPEYHLLITGPLFAFALAWHWVWPLAIASILLSAAVCTVAAAQAQLPKSKRRFYSRPLVALLFLLQPIERGLARYRSQLRFRPAAGARWIQELDSNRPASEPEVLAYWSDGSTDRFNFLRALLRRLEKDKWQIRSDSGWADYDVEILEARWCRLRLITASEFLDRGRISLRCRLQTRWSLAAKVLFWALLLADTAVARLIGPKQPWIWMLLLTVPMLGWVLEFQQAKLRRAVAALLDEVAAEQKLVKLPQSESPQSPGSALVSPTCPVPPSEVTQHPDVALPAQLAPDSAEKSISGISNLKFEI